MYEVHEWAKVRELYREGVSGKAIARRLDMSRNTVARLLASAAPPRYEREPAGSHSETTPTRTECPVRHARRLHSGRRARWTMR